MADVFDALREADKERCEWAKAARAFERNIERITDKASIAWLERVWDQEISRPLAKASEGWKLVEEARDEVVQEMPLSFEEWLQSDIDASTQLAEVKKWQVARAKREEELQAQVLA